MKEFVLIVSLCFSYLCSLAQSTNVEKIRDYYHSLDKNTLIDSMILSSGCEFNDLCEFIFGDSTVKREDMITVLKDNSVIALSLKTKNTIEYTFKKNIYDYLAIDTIETRVMCFNDRNGKLAVLDSQRGLRIPEYFGRDYKRLTKVWELIRREKPDAIFVSSWIFAYRDSDDIDYMWLKDGKIYIYLSKYRDVYELNKYIRKFLKEKRFKRDAILYEQGLELVG